MPTLAGVDRDEIIRLSREYGGEWIVGHAGRLLKLIAAIGDGLEYNRDAIWLAAWLHDWGACPKWALEGVSHSRRSRELAAAYLKKTPCPREWIPLVLEAVEFHHGGYGDRSIEAVLLGDADALDSLGVLGVLKEFTMIPAEMAGDYCLPADFGMREAFERVRIRRENLPRMLKLEKSRALAAERLADMDRIFALIERDSFGLL
ncbi:MAG TPA: HD domain-containing protein [Bryobacteraceae bacterium]|nr:HD domain-containing protein [Bryobacteraceae bacterium]